MKLLIASKCSNISLLRKGMTVQTLVVSPIKTAIGVWSQVLTIYPTKIYLHICFQLK